MGRNLQTRGQIRAKLIAQSVRLENGCWEWTGPRWGGGGEHRRYGATTYLGKTRSAHKVSYMIFKGEIPEGMEIEHICQFPLCVNPDHLQPATHFQNCRRAYPWLNEGKRKCGHPVGKGYRPCLACLREKRIEQGLTVKGFCKNGHDLSKVPTIRTGNGRRCKICWRDNLRFIRHTKISKGICIASGCNQKAEKGIQLCPKHRKYQAIAVAKYKHRIMETK